MFTSTTPSAVQLGQGNGGLQTSSSFSPPTEKISKSLYFFTGAMIFLNIAAAGMVFFGFQKREEFKAQIDVKNKDLKAITYRQDIPLSVMQDFSGRLKGIMSIFNNAPSAYNIFTIFENGTERGIFFGQMQAVRVEGTKSYRVTVAGNSRSYHELISQLETLRSPSYVKYVSNVKVTSYDYDPEKGGVTFNLSFMTTIGRFSSADLIVDLTKPDISVVKNVSGVASSQTIPKSGTSSTTIKIIDSAIASTTSSSLLVSTSTSIKTISNKNTP